MKPIYKIRSLDGNRIQCIMDDKSDYLEEFPSEQAAKNAIQSAIAFDVEGIAGRQKSISFVIIETYKHTV